MLRHLFAFLLLLAVASCSPPDPIQRSTASGRVEGVTTLGPVSRYEFRVLAVLQVGRRPHQIAFTSAGRTAWVAASGSDRVTRIDVVGLEVNGGFDVPGEPFGLLALPGDSDIAVTRYGAGLIGRYRLADGAAVDSLRADGGPTLFGDLYGDNRYLVPVERENEVWVLDPKTFTLRYSFPTGAGPGRPSTVPDGLTAFIPNYDDGTVSIREAEKDRVVATLRVGTHPSGGTVLKNGITYAVAVRGENRVVFLDRVRRQIDGEVSLGIGDEPESVVMTRDGRTAFVSNSGSNDLSVMSVEDRLIAARVPVGDGPDFMTISPDGSQLWISCERSHDVWVLEIPRRLR